MSGGELIEVVVSPDWKVEQLYEWIKDRQDLCVSRSSLSPSPRNLRLTHRPPSLCPHSQLKKPSLSTSAGPLYFAAPPQLEAATAPNLSKLCKDVFAPGAEISVTDAALPFQMSLRVTFE